ncbi:hypothetical protein CCICO_08155 [Corynebacterium ciconiae DSM 44920]|uniref:divisome protein SepX/GlpR n=1 Tax=Corynebacterium ciconiae TaxID=227319 RepID=UPI0003736B6B|nr:gephyrin-like molybdotransferase receptor GlpR [Corynebacterium ciconiae]WKD61646.1 hypothetical protein CCICO_08155 [Corynebacterium ciconiae DSM 44920]
MSGTVAIAVMVVVWLFVLAPLALRGQKPIRRTNKAFDETRVVYEGGSGDLPRATRPRWSRRDVRAETPQPAVEAEEVDPEDILIDDTPRRSAASTEAVAQEVDGDVVRELEAARAERAVISAEQESEDNSDSELPADEDEQDAELTGAAEDLDEDVVADEDIAAEPPVAEDAYDIDSSYAGPSDLLHPAAHYDDADEIIEPSDYDDEAAEIDEEATDEDREFAASRRGRGWYDPEADADRAHLRYQRRQRTLVGLGVSVLLGLALGIIVGGWAWLVALLAMGLTGLYLYALRQQVRAEQQLRRRRLRHLRRARLGVRTDRDEEMGVPQRLRRPGAVVLDMDDESPDFEYLDTMDAGEYFYDDYYDEPETSYNDRQPRRVS